jgi:SPP1 family phage portal protein
VNSAVTFLFGKPVTLIINNNEPTDADKEAMSLIEDVWKQNKLDYLNKQLARDLFIECKTAELWHVPPTPEGEDKRIRVSILSKRTGYSIYPHFDEYGDMDAFTIKYEATGADGKPEERVTIYTATNITEAAKRQSVWDVQARDNIAGLIPIVYIEQDKPEWDGVTSQINRDENLVSNFADTNDYFGAPVLQSKGKVAGLPQKESTGKVVTVEGDVNPITGETTYNGGIDFVTWQNSPESIKLEHEILKDTIYGMTQTPDLSFQNVKGMGAVSGIALLLMFLDSTFKALDKQEVFGPAMERRLSIMKAFISLANVKYRAQIAELDIDIKFNSPIPADTEALIRSLSVARGGEPIMSEETAVRNNPLVQDAQKDIDALAGEKSALKSFAESYTV